MTKRLIYLTFLALVSFNLCADEGMWLPSRIAQRIKDMQRKGLNLSAEDIYSINGSSIKDAIVHFGGGCTGELISPNGLLITNHHCGFSQIQSHSSVEHDYLKNGFWAETLKDELPNKSLVVSFLDNMKDVTSSVFKGVKAKMTEEKRNALIKKNTNKILDSVYATEGKGLMARVLPLYYGNQYFLYVYKVYPDVRLVGAPPASIGKFGGDTDNWMWPRHTGDFSLFRIYADENNEPAEYSPNNVPFKAKRFFTINASGIKEGDFTMVYGYPGRTNEYLHSDAVRQIAYVSNPAKIKLRTKILDIQKREMEKDNAVRIKYASKNASVANAWKKWQGEMKGIKRLNTVAEKQEYERRFTEWAKEKPAYNGIIERFHELYTSVSEIWLVEDYQKEALNAVELIKYAGGNGQNRELFEKDYYKPIDKDVFIALYSTYAEDVPQKYQSDFFKSQIEKFGSVEKWADDLYSFDTLPDNAAMAKAKEIYDETNSYFKANLAPKIKTVFNEINLLYRTYMKAQIEYNEATNGNRVFYPDANSTLRVAYGNVKGYSPSDAVYYTPVSTLDGIMQKDNPNIYDYDVPKKLRQLYASKDFGRWNVNGTVPVAFIATNHTTGGNSGSPVIDKDGKLIGVNFDRVWEGTMSDVVFDPDYCRNIALDIRYALFLIDKLAGAQRLLDEMVIE